MRVDPVGLGVTDRRVAPKPGGSVFDRPATRARELELGGCAAPEQPSSSAADPASCVGPLGGARILSELDEDLVRHKLPGILTLDGAWRIGESYHTDY